MKTWSYKSITTKAEADIKTMMAKGAYAADDFHRRMYRDWAYGVFLGWKNLTMGWMTDGDCERLEDLTVGGEGGPDEV